jgi:hypothetical protein
MKPLVRTITTSEGRYLHLDDLKSLMGDDAFTAECAAMMVVGKNEGDNAFDILRRSFGYALSVASGDMERMKSGAAKQIVKEFKPH